MENEIWKKHPEYIGYLKVSNFGRVSTYDSVYYINGFPYKKNGKILKGTILNNGYRQYTLTVNNIEFKILAHRLVYSCFNGKIPEGLVINHLDGIKDNNNVENLELCTIKENVLHSINVLGNYNHGQYNKRSKLTTKDAISILERKKKGESALQISRDMNIARGTITNIYNGNAWPHITRQ